jgi:glycogen debranching enzyme
MLSLLPLDSPHLGPILDMLRDPEQLWSEYGIRSLSKSHPEFGQGENYWKGPIWVQMNYMVLGALHNTYAREKGPFQARAKEMYEELRRNVVNNVFKVGLPRRWPRALFSSAHLGIGISKNRICMGTVRCPYWRGTEEVRVLSLIVYPWR